MTKTDTNTFKAEVAHVPVTNGVWPNGFWVWRIVADGLVVRQSSAPLKSKHRALNQMREAWQRIPRREEMDLIHTRSWAPGIVWTEEKKR